MVSFLRRALFDLYRMVLPLCHSDIDCRRVNRTMRDSAACEGTLLARYMSEDINLEDTLPCWRVLRVQQAASRVLTFARIAAVSANSQRNSAPR